MLLVGPAPPFWLSRAELTLPAVSTANECTLTIAGHYLIALNRATGAIEGLYCDPSTPPHQSLKLRPEVNSLGGAAAEGGYQLGDFGVL